jgi:ubiquinone/menaquinone biosynthesis C-methylase UbiE
MDSRLYLSGWFRNRVLSNFLKSDNKDQWLLDVGGGTGNVSGHLRNRFFGIVVLDNDISSLRGVRGSRLHPVLGDARCLPFKNECFHRALSVDFQEHLTQEDVPKYLQEVRRILQNHGVVAVFASCRGFTIRRWLYWMTGKSHKGDLDWADWAKDGHRNRLRAFRHRQLVQEAGFRLAKWRFCGHFFDPLVRRFHVLVMTIVAVFMGGRDQVNSLERSYRAGIPNVWIEGYFWVLKSVAYLDCVLFGRIPGGAIFMKLVKNGKTT